MKDLRAKIELLYKSSDEFFESNYEEEEFWNEIKEAITKARQDERQKFIDALPKVEITECENGYCTGLIREQRIKSHNKMLGAEILMKQIKNNLNIK